MQTKTFVGKGNEKLVFERSKSHGYKKLEISEDVKMASPITYESDGETLKVVVDKSINTKVDEPQFTFICREFGLHGFSKGVSADISVIFLDDGNMLVTLYDGSLILNYEDDLIQPIVGEHDELPVIAGNILWINADYLLAHKEFFGSNLHQVYTQDFEYFFTVKGQEVNNMSSFTMRPFRSMYIDLSCGYIAMLEEQQRVKDEAREVKKMTKAMISNITESSGLDFDDDEDYDEDYEDDEDYDEYDEYDDYDEESEV